LLLSLKGDIQAIHSKAELISVQGKFALGLHGWPTGALNGSVHAQLAVPPADE